MRTAFVVLLLRDVRVLRRNFGQFLLRTVMQPLLFAFVFAYVFPKIGQGIGDARGTANFSTVLVPGLMAAAILIQGIQAVALPLVAEFSYTKEIEDRVLAPMPVWLVGFGKVVSGALQGVLAALVVFPIVRFVHAPGQAPSVHIANYPEFAVTLLLAAFMGAAVGLLIGTAVAPQQVPLVFSIFVLPASLLGCIYYPWATLTPIHWLKVAVLVNPLVYMSESMRAVLTPAAPHMHLGVALLAMLGASAVLLLASLRAFHRRVVA